MICSTHPTNLRRDLLADAEVAEDDVEEILDADGACDAAETAEGQTQVFGSQFGQRRCKRAAQCRGGFLEGLPVARSGLCRCFDAVVLCYPLAERHQ